MSWAAVGGAAASAVIGGVIANEFAPDPDTSASDEAADVSRMQAQISKEQWESYKKNYLPLEQDLIAEARKSAYDPAEIAAAEGRAAADVTGAYEQAARSTENRMRSYGINPASPAYGSAMASTGLAEGAALAGARTTAGERVREKQKNQGYSRMLDVVGLGRGIPAQSAASAAGAASSAGIAQAGLNAQYDQRRQSIQDVGYELQPIVGAARSYYENRPQQITYNANPNSQSFSGQQINLGNSGGYQAPTWGYESGRTQYAEGGEVGLEKHGMRRSKISRAVKKAMMTPHMRKNGYANGGGVGMQGMEPSRMNRVMNGPGTETSDSIPANVDGQQTAALSTGEFVMSAEVPKLSGEEILQAINRAGLEKREQNNAQRQDAGMIGLEQGEYRG